MSDDDLTDDELRNEVGKAMEPLWWIRQYLDDDSEQAKAFDEVRAYAQGLDDEPPTPCPVCGGAGIVDTSPPGVEHTAPSVVGEISGPFPMYGFEGCTDIDPDICACATDADIECAVCGEEIVPDTPTYARAEGLPWLDSDDVEQEWTTLWWHATCDGRAERP